MIPVDGSTLKVIINGSEVGNVNYNIYRADIAGLFPGYLNSSGAHGYLAFDTSAYADGLHTIMWVAADNAGNSDGIGSRYFYISNSGNSLSVSCTASPLSGKSPLAVKTGDGALLFYFVLSYYRTCCFCRRAFASLYNLSNDGNFKISKGGISIISLYFNPAISFKRINSSPRNRFPTCVDTSLRSLLKVAIIRTFRGIVCQVRIFKLKRAKMPFSAIKLPLEMTFLPFSAILRVGVR
jgi:hypothetical protein